MCSVAVVKVVAKPTSESPSSPVPVLESEGWHHKSELEEGGCAILVETWAKTHLNNLGFALKWELECTIQPSSL